MNVPFVDLRAQYASIQTEVRAAMEDVCKNTNFILGQPVTDFEKAFAEYCGCAHGVGVASGLDALKLALRALDIGPGDEVITAANTFIATTLAISLVGATPVLVDIDPATYNIDPRKIRAAITGKTKAIIPVHLYGQPADMDPIVALAREFKLKIIEDASQAHGSRYKGKRVGGFSDIAAFSLYPGKNLGAYGDAGVIVTNHADLAENVAMLRNNGSKVKYYHLAIGENSRLDTIHAAVLKVKLPHLDDWNARRRLAAARYTAGLQGVKGIVTPVALPTVEPIYHLYVIRSTQREALMSFLKDKGVSTIIHYPVPIHLQEAYKDRGWKKGDFPLTETACEQIVSLPMFPEITTEQIDYVVGAIKAFAAQG